MIIAVFLLITVSLAVFTFIGRRRETLWLAGIYTGFILVNTGLMLFYAKMGGLGRDEQFLFFIFPSIQRLFQDLPVPLSRIAFVVTAGQSLFLFSILVFSLDMHDLLRGKWLLAAAAWPVFNLAVCNADFLLTLDAGARDALIRANFYGMLGCFLFAAALMLREYFGHTIVWVRRQLRYIILSLADIVAYYLLYCHLNPLFIVSQSVFPPMGFGFPLQYRFRLSLGMWVFSIVLLVAIYVVGVVSLYKYTRVTIDMNEENLALERQIDTASMGVRVFIHGMKNQLLSEKIILERLRRAETSPGGAENGAEEEKWLGELERINARMTSRMDALYDSLRQKSFRMEPHRASDFVRSVLEKHRSVHPEIRFELRVETDSTFMADANYLGEALDNIVKNAAEAVLSRWGGTGGAVTVTVKAGSRWCAVRVDDNGAGMTRDKLGKIFKPFFTDKKTGNNWGVGLSSARRIVRHHFGRVYAESRPGHGSSFIVTLPRAHG